MKKLTDNVKKSSEQKRERGFFMKETNENKSLASFLPRWSCSSQALGSARGRGSASKKFRRHANFSIPKLGDCVSVEPLAVFPLFLTRGSVAIAEEVSRSPPCHFKSSLAASGFSSSSLNVRF
jgi:hypothetical protein